MLNFWSQGWGVLIGTSINKLVESIYQADFQDDCFLWFADSMALKSAVKLDPNLKIKVNASNIAEIKRWQRICAPYAIETAAKNINDELRGYCSENNIRIMAAIKDATAESYREALSKNPDIVNLDAPELWQRINVRAEDLKIAFLADVHLHEIYTTLDGAHFDSAPHDSLGRSMLIRPMAEQLRSTRLFNENYYAFIAALDDIVDRGVNYVVLAGDFSDNGQIYNVKGLRKILDHYSEKYSLDFFITTGNHDPVRPYTNSDVSINFLDSNGATQRVFGTDGDNRTCVSSDVSYLGYDEIVSSLDSFGFMPQPRFVYWESPFSSYSYDNYTYESATKESSLEHRQYGENHLPDASYLVEPVEGLWLLAIDANAYPLKESANDNPLDPSNYGSPSDGYSITLEHKKHLIKWIESVSKRAKDRGKRLVAFSHYPMVDFFHGASEEVVQLLGDGAMQHKRNPTSEIAETFADAGITLHFAGHMHIDDTSKYTSKNGNTLLNIQIPSLAGYYPGYKLLEIKDGDYSIESIPIDDVEGFDSLFDLYATEYEYLLQNKASSIWNRDILSVDSYGDFLRFHLRELVRLRFVPKDWNGVVTSDMLNATGAELLKIAEVDGVEDDDYTQFTGFDIIYDLYRIFDGGELAMADVTPERLKEYHSMLVLLQSSDNPQNTTTKQLIKILNLVECLAY